MDYKWEIHSLVLNKVFNQWGMLSWDLFVSQANKKCLLYGSRATLDGLKVRCPYATMEGSFQVCFPSHLINTMGYVENLSKQGLSHPFFAQLAEMVLVQGTSETSNHMPVNI